MGLNKISQYLFWAIVRGKHYSLMLTTIDFTIYCSMNIDPDCLALYIKTNNGFVACKLVRNRITAAWKR